MFTGMSEDTCPPLLYPLIITSPPSSLCLPSQRWNAEYEAASLILNQKEKRKQLDKLAEQIEKVQGLMDVMQRSCARRLL